MRIRLLLLPLTLIYSSIVRLRNWLFNIGWLKSQRFDKPIICVGNITVGGTGKTPLIEFLIRLLTDARPSLISRGYKRKTKGLVVAHSASTAADIGDEPMQIHTKFPQLPIVVDADRVRGISELVRLFDTDVVLMDDGFQHRRVVPGFSIVVADYARPMWRDFVFPAGNLREPMSGCKRADIVVVNKCPDNLTVVERNEIARRLELTARQTVYFTAIGYGALTNSQGVEVELSLSANVLAVAGIGRPEPFFCEAKKRFANVATMAFDDHHNFDISDVEKIKQRLAAFGSEAVVVTTEKDFMRFPDLGEYQIYYIPITLNVLFGQAREFEQKIKEYVRKD